MLRDDAIIAGAVIIIGIAGAWWAKNKAGELWKAVPEPVREGVEATGVMLGAAGDIALHPLDGFGVTPGFWQDGSGPKWTPTTPQANPDDAVSNGQGGMNFNLF